MNQVELEDTLSRRLVQYGYTQAPLLERARSYKQSRGMTLGRALLELKLVGPDALQRVLEEVTGSTTVDPSLLTVYPEYIQTVTKLIPADFVRGALVFPVQSERNAIKVAMLNPTDAAFVSVLEGLSGCHIHPVAGHEHQLAKAIAEHYGAPVNGLPEAAIDGAKARALGERIVRARLETPLEKYAEPVTALVNRNRDKLTSPQTLETVVRDPDLVQFVHQVLIRLVHAGASDIHFEPLETEFRIRSRIDGAMRTFFRLAPAVALACIARVKVMAGMDLLPSREPLDARISYDLVWGREVDFRFSSLPSLHGEKIVLRALDRSKKLQGLTELGFDARTLERVKGVAEGPNGLVLVTGPTGSGKTSTLYALVGHLNKDDVNIVSAEDPVESKIAGVTQVHCGEETGIGFADALRSFLRQDPDVILVGEIRDQETADIALKAALTGHLVLSTLHTNDAPSTILRLLNMDLDPFMVGSAVRLVLAQRLVRRLCDACKVASSSSIPNAFTEREAAILKGATVYEAGGCELCGQSGYRGRRGIFEALVVSEPLEEAIASRASAGDIRELAIQEGMTTLRESGLARVAAGETTLDEVLANTLAS